MIDTFEEMNVDEFILGCVKKLCIGCGVPLSQNDQGRPRKFCSAECRKRYWKRTPRRERWPSFREMVCPVCGRTFFIPRENTRWRKYCSHACANRARGMIGEPDENMRIENAAGIRTQTGGVQSPEETEAGR